MLASSINLVNHGAMSVEEQPNYLAIYEDFATTKYGQTLAANVRYEIYKPENMSNQRWIEVLGPDADNLQHLVSTYHLTNQFIEITDNLQPGELSRRDKLLLPTGAITHDCAESITTDINYSDKTDQHETEEKATFLEHMNRFFPDTDPEVLEIIEGAVEEIIFNRKSRLERIGYLQVAIRASEHLYEGTASECVEGLSWLVADTLSNHQATHVIAAGRRFPAAHRFLELYQAGLDTTFEVGQSAGLTVFAKFDPNRAVAKEAHLKMAVDIWDSWGGEFDSGELKDS